MIKDKTNAWKKFGYSFWVTFSVITIMLGILGFLFTALSIYEIIFEAGRGFWFGLCFYGVFSVVAGLLCSKLLPAWAEMVRTYRLLEERFKGAVGATSVAQFVKVDEERKAALVQAVEEKQNETGNAMLKILNQHKKEVEKLTFKTDENINDIMKSVNAINGRLEALENPVILSQIIDETKKMRQELNDIMSQANAPRVGSSPESLQSNEVDASKDEVEALPPSKPKHPGGRPKGVKNKPKPRPIPINETSDEVDKRGLESTEEEEAEGIIIEEYDDEIDPCGPDDESGLF